MSESIQKTLVALKDVSGTKGSFVLNKDGKLLAMEMPSLFDVAMFSELGPRIERLAETFSSLGDELESCLIRFADHMLCIKQFPTGGALCILTDNGVSLPALKMAVNLAHRRLAAEVPTAEPMSTKPEPAGPPTNGAAAVAAPPPLPAAAEPPAAASSAVKAPLYYRGHLVEG